MISAVAGTFSSKRKMSASVADLEARCERRSNGILPPRSERHTANIEERRGYSSTSRSSALRRSTSPFAQSGHMFEVTLIIAYLRGYPVRRFAIRRRRSNFFGVVNRRGDQVHTALAESASRAGTSPSAG